jgi:hypothetical protein
MDLGEMKGNRKETVPRGLFCNFKKPDDNWQRINSVFQSAKNDGFNINKIVFSEQRAYFTFEDSYTFLGAIQLPPQVLIQSSIFQSFSWPLNLPNTTLSFFLPPHAPFTSTLIIRESLFIGKKRYSSGYFVLIIKNEIIGY